MSDLSVIVTGIVVGAASGIGGAVLGAWMNGRSQLAALKLSIAAEDQRAQLAEKRRIYARFLVNHDPDRFDSFEPLADLVMVGDNAVVACALDAVMALGEDPGGQQYRDAIGALLEVIRADLGKPGFDWAGQFMPSAQAGDAEPAVPAAPDG